MAGDSAQGSRSGRTDVRSRIHLRSQTHSSRLSPHLSTMQASLQGEEVLLARGLVPGVVEEGADAARASTVEYCLVLFCFPRVKRGPVRCERERGGVNEVDCPTSE